MSPLSAPEGPYGRVVKALMAESNVTYSRNTLWVKRKMFAYCNKEGRLLVKLPSERVNELIASGKGMRFGSDKGPVVKEWLTVDPSLREKWLPLAKEALKFVSTTK